MGFGRVDIGRKRILSNAQSLDWELREDLKCDGFIT